MRIIIPGAPVPQLRMKSSHIRGFTRHYDPKAKEKKHIREYLSHNYSVEEHLDFPRVSFIFHMPIPSSIPKRLIPLYYSGLLKHTKKPDTDNLIKLYLDCMDGLVLHQDSKVSLGFSVKVYHPYPKTIIWIHKTSELLSPLEVDPLAWYFLFDERCGRQTSCEMASLSDLYNPHELVGLLSDRMIYPTQTTGLSEPPPSAQTLLELGDKAYYNFLHYRE